MIQLKSNKLLLNSLQTRLKEIISSCEDEEIFEMFSYIIHQRESYVWGSQSRGRLFLAMTGESSITLDIACAIEIWHNVSLIVDDVIDDSLYRRQIKSFWNEYSKTAAFTMAFYLDRVAMNLIQKNELTDIAKIFNQCTMIMASFETKSRIQITNHEQYLENSYIKTANLYVSTYRAAIKFLNQSVSTNEINIIKLAGLLHQFHDDKADWPTEKESHNNNAEIKINWLSLSVKEKQKLSSWVHDANKKLLDEDVFSESDFFDLSTTISIVREIACINKNNLNNSTNDKSTSSKTDNTLKFSVL